MSNRVPIRKSVRFEVFKRDLFTCQYCGAKSPDVVLQVDHIVPVCEGGTNDILNLVTACTSCNSGKSGKRLSDSSAVEKSRKQAEESQERLGQIEMLADWHASLVDVDLHAVNKLEELWLKSVSACSSERLTDTARNELLSVIKKYGFSVSCEAVAIAAAKCMRKPPGLDNAMACNESFWSISRICSVLKQDEKSPGVARLFYIRGILRNRLPYLHEGACISLLKEAKELGVPVDWLCDLAKSAESWSEFRGAVTQRIDELCGYQD